VRLTTADTTSTTGDYLNGQPPAWATLEAGLAVFALFVIVRFCVRRCYTWLGTSERPSLNLPVAAPFRRQNAAQGQHNSPEPADWEMDEKARSKSVMGRIKGHHVSFGDEEILGRKSLAIDPHWGNGGDSVPRQLMSRPPPAPPLTPPELSTTVFTFEDRPRSQESFIHQPNPDYMSPTDSSTSQTSSASPTTPRKRSYNKTIPVGVPVSRHLSAADSEAADLTFSPSSYPPTSPLLPPAPPGLQVRDFEESGSNSGSPQAIEVKGEIIQLLDGDGVGWSRHTRVYGGGVCLACAASGDDHGGFYGATVRPEEMR